MIDTANYENLLANQSKLKVLNKRVREAKYDLKRYQKYVKDAQADTGPSFDPTYKERLIAKYRADIAKYEAKLAALLPQVETLEAQRPEVNRYTEILEGLKGNIVEVARNAIEIVIASEEYGSWVPNGSRKVNGLVEKKGQGANWKAFREAVKALNEKRNRAVFIVDPSNVSPTVRKTLDGLKLDSKTIRVAPIEYKEVEVALASGRKVKALRAFLVWPKGTVHNASRFHSTDNNFQCQACGHAIRNPFNWVPVLVDNAKGVPHSIWVGRDCAKNLFGIELRGALALAEGQR